MRLSALEPEWLKLTEPGHWRRVETRAEADGLLFLCPVCFEANGGPVGTHAIICWEPSVPADEVPGPGRWTMVGDSFETLTLTAGSSSVLLTSGCRAHFFVRDGAIVPC